MIGLKLSWRRLADFDDGTPRSSPASLFYNILSAASAVPALMSSTPVSPWIRTSNSFCVIGRSPEKMELVTQLPK